MKTKKLETASEPENLDYKALYEEEHARVIELTNQIIEITKALAARPVAAENQADLPPAGKGKAAAAKADAQAQPEEEETRPATKEDLDDYYVDRSLKALKKMKPMLMSALTKCIPDKELREKFILSLPAPKTLRELKEQLFAPACEKGVLLPQEAIDAQIAHLIYPVLCFSTPVQERYVNTEINKLLSNYLK